MAQRIAKSYTLQEEYVEVIKRRARELCRSESYIIEMALHEIFAAELPLDVMPGRILPKEKSQ